MRSPHYLALFVYLGDRGLRVLFAGPIADEVSGIEFSDKLREGVKELNEKLHIEGTPAEIRASVRRRRTSRRPKLYDKKGLVAEIEGLWRGAYTAELQTA